MTDSETIILRDATPADAHRIAGIYNHYVANTIVTFEEEPVAAAEISQRIANVQASTLPWLVAVSGPEILGYAYAVQWRVRKAYRFSVEVTVYVSPGQEGKGIGTLLYAALIPALQERKIHASMGGIALPNPASIALHEKFGFAKVAHLEQVGFKFGRWIDVGYWQRLL